MGRAAGKEYPVELDSNLDVQSYHREGLGRAAGKEDPVELDSNLDVRDVLEDVE